MKNGEQCIELHRFAPNITVNRKWIRMHGYVGSGMKEINIAGEIRLKNELVTNVDFVSVDANDYNFKCSGRIDT